MHATKGVLAHFILLLSFLCPLTIIPPPSKLTDGFAHGFSDLS